MPLFLPLISLQFSVYSFFFSILSPLSFYFSFLSFSPIFFLLLPLPSSALLFTTTPFYTICHGGIYHFYPLTTFGSLWVSFQDYPLANCLFSHYHYSKCVCCTTLHSQTKLLVLFFYLSLFFTFLIQIRIKSLHYLPLWHASSGLNPYLPLLGEMPFQQDISPKET